MPYRCPLCLKELDENDVLVRFCLQHENGEAFNFSEENIGEKLLCPLKEKGDCETSIDDGIFIRHLQCEAINPFWDEITNRVDIPGGPDYENTATVPHVILDENDKPSNVEVNHWEILMLRSVEKEKEMWFPVMLLRATTETYRGKRIGALVEMAGAMTSGKTVIAMQAMDEKGYIHEHETDRNINLNNFIYSKRLGNLNPFLDLLYLRDLMRRNHAYIPTEGTWRGERSVKAIFIDGMQTHIDEESNSSEALDVMRESTTGFLGDIWQNLKQIFANLFGSFAPEKTVNTDRPFYYTVSFYDIGGEDHKIEDRIIRRTERAVEKIAVLVKATEIFDEQKAGEKYSSVNEAVKKLGQLKSKKRLKASLVITHVDRLEAEARRMNLKNLPELESDIKTIRRIAENLRDNPEDDKEARNLLSKWVKASAHPSVKQLANLPRGMKVFFVWTEGIPEDGAPREGAITYSYGLARFMCWCLGVRWDEINQAEPVRLNK